jgi:hypothetical protein
VPQHDGFRQHYHGGPITTVACGCIKQRPNHSPPQSCIRKPEYKTPASYERGMHNKAQLLGHMPMHQHGIEQRRTQLQLTRQLQHDDAPANSTCAMPKACTASGSPKHPVSLISTSSILRS